jgi:hypothetical protein
MLACRLCRVPLSAEKGCAHCDPVRQNLVVLGETEEERPSLAGTSNEAIHGLRDQIKYHKGILKTNPGSTKSEDSLVKCTNALAKIVGETRKLQDDGFKVVEAMSFQERLEMFIGWYVDLPPAYRLSLRERMADHEVRISAPLNQEGATDVRDN